MKKIFCILVICFFAVFLTSCAYLPEYKDLGKDVQKGSMIEVNGIVYRTLPETDWRPIWAETKQVARKYRI